MRRCEDGKMRRCEKDRYRDSAANTICFVCCFLHCLLAARICTRIFSKKGKTSILLVLMRTTRSRQPVLFQFCLQLPLLFLLQQTGGAAEVGSQHLHSLDDANHLTLDWMPVPDHCRYHFRHEVSHPGMSIHLLQQPPFIFRASFGQRLKLTLLGIRTLDWLHKTGDRPQTTDATTDHKLKQS